MNNFYLKALINQLQFYVSKPLRTFRAYSTNFLCMHINYQHIH